MKPLVVDANIIMAALIRDGPTREEILDRDRDLHSPSWLWEEIDARRELILRKSGLSANALRALEMLLQARIRNIPDAAVVQHIVAAMEMVGKAGAKDAPYVAAVLAVGGVLWTHDKALVESLDIPTVTTAGLIAEREP